MAETRQVGRLTIHFLGDNAAQLAKSFDGSLSVSRSFRDAMAETARTQRHIYVGSSLDDLRDQPGFDRAGFPPDSKAVREGSAFGKPSGAESYFIVVTNREHHLTLDGRVFPGSTDLPLVHELLHPTQIMRTLTETGQFCTNDSEARTQMREQKIAEELGRIPGQDFPDVRAEFLRPLETCRLLRQTIRAIALFRRSRRHRIRKDRFPSMTPISNI